MWSTVAGTLPTGQTACAGAGASVAGAPSGVWATDEAVGAAVNGEGGLEPDVGDSPGTVEAVTPAPTAA